MTVRQPAPGNKSESAGAVRAQNTGLDKENPHSQRIFNEISVINGSIGEDQSIQFYLNVITING